MIRRRADQAVPARVRLACGLEPRFIFPTVFEKVEPVIELIREYIETDYGYPTTMGALKDDIELASRQILEGLEGDASRRCTRPTRSTCEWRR